MRERQGAQEEPQALPPAHRLSSRNAYPPGGSLKHVDPLAGNASAALGERLVAGPVKAPLVTLLHRLLPARFGGATLEVEPLPRVAGDTDAFMSLFVGPLHCRHEFARNLIIDGVENLGTVERDACDAAIPLIERLGHGSNPAAPQRRWDVRPIPNRARFAREQPIGARPRAAWRSRRGAWPRLPVKSTIPIKRAAAPPQEARLAHSRHRHTRASAAQSLA